MRLSLAGLVSAFNRGREQKKKMGDSALARQQLTTAFPGCQRDAGCASVYPLGMGSTRCVRRDLCSAAESVLCVLRVRAGREERGLYIVVATVVWCGVLAVEQALGVRINSA